ncbi:MAG: hypothetical protein QOJ00_2837 [Actinomycetota bacterium]
MGEPESAARPALTIVIPTRDRPVMLNRCLASVHAAVGSDDEVIVVDSASTAPVSADGARVIRLNQPGVNRARNAGWREAAHELVAYVDDDVIVDETWADRFARAAAAHPHHAFYSGRVVAHVTTASSHGNVAVKDDAEPAVLDASSRGDLGHGANLLVRANALGAVRGWDETMGAGAPFQSSPETDLYDRLFAAGFTGRYEPSAVARHDQWRNPTQLVRLDWRYGFGNGARLAKLVRTDRGRARRVAAEAAWGWGLQRLGPALRQRNKTDIARVSARLAGTASGFASAVFTPVRNGHFAPGRSNTSS